MSFDALKGLPEKELHARLNELSQENFKAKFTTEAMTSQRGADIRTRRRELARIKTVLKGRETLKRAKQEETELTKTLEELGAPHTGNTNDKRRRSKLQGRLAQVKRTIRELTPLEGKA
jgi:ribosomal protein L29